MKSRIIICGGRHFNDYEALEEKVDQVLDSLEMEISQIEIVSGHCVRADRLGEQYAENHQVKCSVFPAEWKKHGRSAGPLRNSQMIRYASESDRPVVIAFVSPRSRGTKDTVRKANREGMEVFVYEYGYAEEFKAIDEKNSK